MKKKKRRLNCPILISGYIGSGKSTLAKHLADQFGLKYVSASEIHRKLISERLKKTHGKMKKVQKGFWESEEGKKGMKLRSMDLKIDKEVDVRLLQQLTKHPACITDARLMPWLYPKKALRIWLTASESERAKRVGGRDGLPMLNVRKSIHQRLEMDQKIWKNLYEIPFGKDLSPFDLVLNNDTYTAKETFAVVKAFIMGKILHPY